MWPREGQRAGTLLCSPWCVRRAPWASGETRGTPGKRGFPPARGSACRLWGTPCVVEQGRDLGFAEPLRGRQPRPLCLTSRMTGFLEAWWFPIVHPGVTLADGAGRALFWNSPVPVLGCWPLFHPLSADVWEQKARFPKSVPQAC